MANYLDTPIDTSITNVRSVLSAQGYTWTPLTESFDKYLARALSGIGGSPVSSLTMSRVQLLAGLVNALNAGPVSYLTTGLPQLLDLLGRAGTSNPKNTILANPASFILTGQSAGLIYTRAPLAAALGTFALTGQAAGTLVGRSLTATQGAFALTGQDANLVKATPGAYTLTAAQGTFVLSGDAMTPLVDYKLPAALGTFALSGQVANLLATHSLTAAQGTFALTGIAAALTKAGGSFTGVGDIRSSAVVWYGLRGYNAAYSTGSNPAIDIVDQAGANQLTVNILSSGDLDVASIAAWVTAHSVTTIKVKQLYDQIGTNHLITAGAGGSLIQMPALILSGLGAKPVMRLDGSNNSMSGGASTGLSGPYSLYAVAKGNATNTTKMIFGNDSNPDGIFWAGANTLALFNGGGVVNFTTSATDGNFYTIQAVMNGASSKWQWDTNSGTISSSPGTDGSNIPSLSNGSFFAAMDWVEGGFWSGDQSATGNSVNSNVKTYWGF